MILKYPALFSFIMTVPGHAHERAPQPWRGMGDEALRRYVLRLGERFDPVEAFGTPESTWTSETRTRIFPKGNRDLLVVETIPSATAGLEKFSAVRLKRAFEVKTIGPEAGTIQTVWEIRLHAKASAAKRLLHWLRK